MRLTTTDLGDYSSNEPIMDGTGMLMYLAGGNGAITCAVAASCLQLLAPEHEEAVALGTARNRPDYSIASRRERLSGIIAWTG
jgi:hypothetical protein